MGPGRDIPIILLYSVPPYIIYSDMAKLTVCVITYNSTRYLQNLLESIRDSSLRDIDLIFIDNASTDGTADRLEKDPFTKTVIRLERNMGHSYAANLAISKCNTRYLILLDHDTVVGEDLFLKLYEAAEAARDTSFAVFAPVINDHSRGETYYGGAFHFIGKTYTGRKMPADKETGMIGSTAPLIDMEKVPADLVFDDDFFIYWNDADFFYRLRALGLKIQLVPEAAVDHLAGTVDYSHRGGTEYSPVRAYFVLRNHRLFLIKNYSFASLVLFAPCFLLYEIFNIAFCLRKRVFLKGYLRSVWGTLVLLPSMLRKRAVFQSRRVLGEKDLVGWYRLDYNPGVVSSGAERRCVEMLDAFLGAYYRFVKAVFWK